MKTFVKKITTNPLINRLIDTISKTIIDLRKRFSSKISNLIFINLSFVVFQYLYLQSRFEFINTKVPFWYTNLWGQAQLADKSFLYLIPVTSLAITLLALVFVIPLKRYYVRTGITVLTLITVFSNFVLTYSLLRIIFVASVPFEPLVKPLYLELFVPGFLSFLAVTYVLPAFINLMHTKNIVTNPAIHIHPGMLLKEPTARGGGVFYGSAFIILSVLFIGIPAGFVSLYFALILLSLLGYADDFQNTHPESKLKFLENPYIRLILLFFTVSIVSTLGAKIFSVSLPFAGSYSFNSLIISMIITSVWIVWVLNVLSWSNGIDGQYAGIVGVASLVIMILALRFEPLELIHKQVATLAAVSAGLSFAMARFTWHPSKILWGFGAVCAGLVLSVLSILISSKIITSILIILVPFLDAAVTVIRRLIQKKNPLKGDRGHLHHILLKKGWSNRRIAVFYWFTTALFGGLSILTVERFTIQAGLIIVGIVAFLIVILNLGLLKKSSE